MDEQKLIELAKLVETLRGRVLELEAKDHHREAALIEIRNLLENERYH